MPRRLLIAAAALLLMGAAPHEPAMTEAEAVGLSAERLKRIDEVLERHIAAGRITGAVVKVSRRGRLVHSSALGLFDPATGVPMRQDALFQMYSSTKPLTAAAVLILMEEGRLRLEDPVSRYLPAFRGARVAVRRPGDSGVFQPRPPGAPPPPHDTAPAIRDLTIRDLMTHVSGLATSDPRRIGMTLPARDAGEPLASYARKLGAVPLDHQPGSRWSYSPLAGADVLAGVVEVVSGQRFETFLRERILAPIGMTDTAFNPAPSQRARLAPVYRREGEEWRRVPPAATGEAAILAGTNPDSGAMGLVSTARDFLLWEETLLAGGLAPNGTRILGPRTVSLMRTNHVGDLYTGEGAYPGPITGHGFGLLVHVVLDHPNAETGRSNGAAGWGGYLGTTSWNDPAEDIAAVILIQQNVREVQLDFERAIRQAIID